jgi:hypothetical protein
MDIKMLVVGYILISFFCTVVYICACIVGGRLRHARKRVVPVSHAWHRGHPVDAAIQVPFLSIRHKQAQTHNAT